jgi:hypothetical protein
LPEGNAALRRPTSEDFAISYQPPIAGRIRAEIELPLTYAIRPKPPFRIKIHPHDGKKRFALRGCKCRRSSQMMLPDFGCHRAHCQRSMLDQEGS